IPGPYLPLSTLRSRPHERLRMTRSQCGSLNLHCMKLSFTTPRRFLPAHKETGMNALPSFDLTGQVALVTGAARGLGRAIALALAEAGADVALGLRELGCDAGLEAEIVARGRRTLSLQMDMRDRKSTRLNSSHLGISY